MFELLKDTDVSMMFDVMKNRMYQVLYAHGFTITSKQRRISASAGVDKDGQVQAVIYVASFRVSKG